jgi:hypothetical protein
MALCVVLVAAGVACAAPIQRFPRSGRRAAELVPDAQHPATMAGQLDADSDESGLTSIAASSRTVLATDDLTDTVAVFTEQTSGWAGGQQVATLAVPGASSDLGQGFALAVSGTTAVVGFDGASLDGHVGEGIAYVYDEPAGGWSGTVAPSAELHAPTLAGGDFGTSVAVLGSAIAVAGSNPKRDRAGNIDSSAVYVFTEPPTGWAGLPRPSATLTGSAKGKLTFAPGLQVSGPSTTSPASPGDAYALATGQTLFASGYRGSYDGDDVILAFAEPARGWSGDIHPSASLTPAYGTLVGEQIAIAGNDLYSTGLAVAGSPAQASRIFVFRRPRRGWRGTVHAIARLKLGEVLAQPYLAASGRNVALTTFSCADPGDCIGFTWAIAEARDGWHGTRLTLPALIISFTSQVAVIGDELFATYGDDEVSLYTISRNAR